MVKRRRRYQAVLRSLGLWDAFAAMPRRMQELFAQRKFPDPVLEFETSFPDDADGRALRKTLLKRFAEASITVDDADVSVRDFFAVMGGLMHSIRGLIKDAATPPAVLAFVSQAGPLFDYWCETHLPDVWPSWNEAVIVPLVAHSQIERRLLAATLKQDFTPQGKYVIRLSVGATAPETRRVVLDGAARPMVRFGTCVHWEGVRWTSWEGKPVFAQSHALRQLRSRVNLPKMEPYLEAWMHDSLTQANVVERQGADVLVEFRLRGQRVGYLVVTPLADVVAVRTFLFLTMQGTPEARLLQERLRLSRRDVNWLGLHELKAFTETDLSHDAQLRALLEDCGCGHLFALAQETAGLLPQLRPLAAEMKRYLRMAA